MEVTQYEGCKVTVKVSITPKEAGKAYSKAVKTVNKQISLPGFRKGKVPPEKIIQRFGSSVQQEWKEILVQEAFDAALKETHVYPWSKETIEKPKFETCTLEEGAVILFSYERYPEIPQIDFSTVHLPKLEKAPIGEEQVNAVLDNLLESQAEWEEVNGRASQEGDYVDLTIEAIDQTPPKMIAKNRRFKFNEMGKWLQELIAGKEIGSTFEGFSELDLNSGEDVKKKFKPTKVRITLHGIKKAILPDLNDAFAQSLKVESKDELMKKIYKNLEMEGESFLRQKLVAALEHSLLTNYPMELPASLLKSEAAERLSRKKEILKNTGLSDNEISGMEEEIKQESEKEAHEQLALHFLMNQVAKQGKIVVTQQEINDEIINEIHRNPSLFNKEWDSETSSALVSQITSYLKREKVRDYALAQVAARKENA